MKMKKMIQLILSLQLALTPYYGYSTPPAGNEDPSPRSENQKLTAETSIHILIETMSAIIEGANWNQDREQMLNENPELRQKGPVAQREFFWNKALKDNPALEELEHKLRNIFLLSGQTAERVEPFINSETGRQELKAVKSVNFNNPNDQPVKIHIDNIHVKYDKASRKLVLEGMIHEKTVLRQYIPNMDIINYTYDGEILVLLDKNKGLFAVNMVFAKAYLGLSPVPFTNIPVQAIENLPAEKKNLLNLEFNNDSVRPPSKILKSAQDNINKNIEGRPLVSRGDLILSYTGTSSQKFLVRLIERKKIKAWLVMEHKLMNMMIDHVSPNFNVTKITDFMTKNAKTLINEIGVTHSEDLLNTEERDMLAQRKETSSAYLLASLLLNPLISKNTLEMRAGLDTIINNQNLSPESQRTLTEWRENYDKFERNYKSRIQDNTSNNSSLKKARENAKITGQVFTTDAIFNIAHPEEEKEKKATAIRQIISKMAKKTKIDKISSFIKNQRLDTVLVFAIITGCFLFAGKDLLYIDGTSSFSVMALPHFIALTFLFPIAVLTFVPGLLKLTKPLLKSNRLQKSDKLQNVIRQMDNMDFFSKSLGFGMKLFAILCALPVRAPGFVTGQPHFFSALQKGLNPFESVSKNNNSDIWELANMREDTRLGVSKFRLTKDPKKEYLQNLAVEKQQQVKFLAWLMAVAAVADNADIRPMELLMYTARRRHYTEAEQIITATTGKKWELLWVFTNLQKEIKKINNLDIRTELYKIDPEEINRYYETAVQLAKEFKAKPSLRKKYSMYHAFATEWLKNKARNLAFKPYKYTEILSQETLDSFARHRTSREFWVDNIISNSFSLPATERADYSLSNSSRGTAVNADNFLYTGELHFQDMYWSTLMHLFFASAQNHILFGERQNRVKALIQQFSNMYSSPAGLLHKDKKTNTRSFLREIKLIFDHLITTGEKDNNFGKTLKQDFEIRKAMWPVYFIMVGGMRYFAPGGQSSVSEALMWSLVTVFFGGLVVMSFWRLIAGASKRGNTQIATNRETVLTIRQKLYTINKKAYTEPELLTSDYRQVYEEMENLYSGKIKAKLKQAVEPGMNRDTAVKNSETLLKFLSDHPPFINKENAVTNKFAVAVVTLATTFILVELVNASGNSHYMNWGNVAIGLLGVIFTYKGIDWLYKEKRSWRSFRNSILNMAKKGRGTITNICRRAFRSN